MDEKEKQWRLFFKKVYLKYGTDYLAWSTDKSDDFRILPEGWSFWAMRTGYIDNNKQFTDKFINEVVLGENDEQK